MCVIVFLVAYRKASSSKDSDYFSKKKCSLENLFSYAMDDFLETAKENQTYHLLQDKYKNFINILEKSSQEYKRIDKKYEYTKRAIKLLAQKELDRQDFYPSLIVFISNI